MGDSLRIIAPRWPRMENGDAAALAAIADWDSACPTELCICNQGLTDAGVSSLAQMPQLSTLETLDLSDNHHFITGAGVRALASSPFLTNLRGLNLGGNSIGVAGIHALVESTSLPSLVRLDVSGRDDDKPTDWTSFRDNIGGDEGLELLVNSPWVRRLQVLDISQNNFTRRGVLALIQSPFLENLSILRADTSMFDYFTDNALNQVDLRTLQEHFGDRLGRQPFTC